VHPDTEVPNARPTDYTGNPKIPLHRGREMSEVRIRDRRR
jgi:hypothetical protein